jgi:hypothetical protein
VPVICDVGEFDLSGQAGTLECADCIHVEVHMPRCGDVAIHRLRELHVDGSVAVQVEVTGVAEEANRSPRMKVCVVADDVERIEMQAAVHKRRVQGAFGLQRHIGQREGELVDCSVAAELSRVLQGPRNVDCARDRGVGAHARNIEGLQKRFDVKIGNGDMALCLVVSAQLNLSVALEDSVGHVAVHIHQELVGLGMDVDVDEAGRGLGQIQVCQMELRFEVRLLDRAVAVRFERQQT